MAVFYVVCLCSTLLHVVCLCSTLLHVVCLCSLTSFWFGELQAQNLGVVSLNVHDLLHVVQIMDPTTRRTIDRYHRMLYNHQTAPPTWAPPHLRTPMRSPEARCCPSGLTPRDRMPALLWSVCCPSEPSAPPFSALPPVPATLSVSRRLVSLSST